MTQSGSRDTVWQIPSGTLTYAGDGTVRAHIRAGLRSKAAVLPAVQAVASFLEPPFLGGVGYVHGDDGFTLTWMPTGSARVPLASVVATWRQQAALHIPRALDVAQTISQAVGALHGRIPSRFFLSPLQVFIGRDQQPAIAALPLEGGLPEAVAASRDALAWLSGDEILKAGTIDRAYMIGAALYYCLVDDLYPAHLPDQRRIERMLLYRGGNLAWAKTALTAALPKALAPVAGELASFIMTLLSPLYGRSVSPLQAVRELDRFTAELSAPRLALAWEAEGAYMNALGILNAFEKTASKSDVPWDLLAWLRAKTGDTEGAERARREAPRPADDPSSALIASLRKLIAEGAAGIVGLETAVSDVLLPAANQPEHPRNAPNRPEYPQHGPTSEEHLFLIYVNGRYLQNAKASLKLLNRNYSVTWHKVVKAILEARLLAEMQRWGEVSRICGEAVKLIGDMPNKGSEPGRYAEGYLHLLDGIAHLRAVQGGLSVNFLQDGFDRLQSAWTLSHEARAAGLQPPITSWLSALACEASKTQSHAILALGIEAFLHSVGAAHAEADTPPLPWFDDIRLFP